MTSALIVYASLTGNTEETADLIAESLERHGIEVDIQECTQATPHDFHNYDICLVGSYTYGTDADLPDEIVDFYEELADEDLTGKIYGVFGSGDTFYDKFCQAVDDFEAQFEKTGATKGAVGVKVDLNPEEEDKVAIDVFTAAIAQHFQ